MGSGVVARESSAVNGTSALGLWRVGSGLWHMIFRGCGRWAQGLWRVIFRVLACGLGGMWRMIFGGLWHVGSGGCGT